MWEWAQKPLLSLVGVSVREPALAGRRRQEQLVPLGTSAMGERLPW